MLTLKRNSWHNAWFVESKPVENIVIYGPEGPLLSVGNGSLPDGSAGGNSLPGFPGVNEITNRNKVKYDRLEHFFCKGVLYVNALLFGGYSTVGVDTKTMDEVEVADRKMIDLSIDGEWLTVHEAKFDNYRNTLTGDAAEAIANLYNEKVAGHHNGYLSKRQALRLIRAMPDMLAALKSMNLASAFDL